MFARYALIVALAAGFTSEGKAWQGAGTLAEDKAKAIAEEFLSYTNTSATVESAGGGWAGCAGWVPGSAVGAWGAVALQATVAIEGRQGKVALAANKGAYGAKTGEAAALVFATGGGVGVLNVDRTDAGFPGSAEEAERLFDETMGAGARGELRLTRTSLGNYRAEEQVAHHKYPNVSLKRVIKVYRYKGKTFVAIGGGTRQLSDATLVTD